MQSQVSGATPKGVNSRILTIAKRKNSAVQRTRQTPHGTIPPLESALLGLYLAPAKLMLISECPNALMKTINSFQGLHRSMDQKEADTTAALSNLLIVCKIIPTIQGKLDAT